MWKTELFACRNFKGYKRRGTFALAVALNGHPLVLQALIRRTFRLQRERSAERSIAHHLLRQVVHRAFGLLIFLQMQEHLLQGRHRHAIAADAESARAGLDLVLDGGEQRSEVIHRIVG